MEGQKLLAFEEFGEPWHEQDAQEVGIMSLLLQTKMLRYGNIRTASNNSWRTIAS